MALVFQFPSQLDDAFIGIEVGFEVADRDPTIYLVPECDSQDEAMEYLGESIRDIFEEHLDGWYRAPEVWPARRDLPTFQSWFEVTCHSVIVDLSDDVLEHEEQ